MQGAESTLDFAREIRFAVVMYGGVSLAIYINGVSQELLQLGLATAEDPDHPERPLEADPTGTAATYRALAQILSLPETERLALEAGILDSDDAVLDFTHLPTTIGVKFVIDIISGTSAGGINGIFLGKALANNETLDSLAQMWIREGDILKLLNDSESIADLEGFPSPDPPESLLNAQRMYRRLLEAFDGMDGIESTPQSRPSGFVEDLDVFATTTDVNGLPVFLKLSDGVATERRYKNVFQFRHRQDGQTVNKSNFGKDQNPFLAYAARCTSSFPVAFPPMTLASIGAVLATMPDHLNEQKLGTEKERWKQYFPTYQKSTDIPECKQNPAWFEFQERPFGDGGYLDNKPFGHAIDMLSHRVSRRPVDRKLIYIEPDPENPDLQKASNEAPNAIGNALRSQTLATYESIREDLERVIERNELIERVNRLLAGSDDDVNIWRNGEKFDDDALFNDGDLDALIKKYGAAYGGYHRLKVGSLTDDLAEWVGAAANFQANSAYVTGIGLLVRAWREQNYSRDRDDRIPFRETRVLYDFDFSYRIRRLRFVIQRIDSLRRAGMSRDPPRPSDSASKLFEFMKQTVAATPSLMSSLYAVRQELHAALTYLMQERDKLLIFGEGNPLHAAIGGNDLKASVLDEVLRGRTFDERYSCAQAEIQSNPALLAVINRVAGVLKAYVTRVVIYASRRCRAALKDGVDNAPETGTSVMAQVQAFYVNYQGYDFVSFPVLYSTDVGEELCTTEVIRVSPADSKSLVGLRTGDTRRKLAGTTLMHFGAFLEDKWRRNDMLWGRLDGADRLITSLLPQNCPKMRVALVRDAQIRILKEYYAPMNSKALLDYSSQAVGLLGSSTDATKRLDEFFRGGAGTPGAAQLQNMVLSALQQSLSTETLLEYFRRPDGYTVNMEPTPTSAASALSRSTTITGKMLKKIGDELQLPAGSKVGSWATRVGQITWGLVEVAMPGSLLRLVCRYWFHVAYLLEAVMIVGGVLLGNPGAEKLGWSLLALTVAATTMTWMLGDWFAGRTRARQVVRALLVAILLILVDVGTITIWDWVVHLRLLDKLKVSSWIYPAIDHFVGLFRKSG